MAREQQQCQPGSTHSSKLALPSPRGVAGLSSKQALAADHLELMQLVEVLVTDHKTSLLERQRLQQQLDSVHQALQAERLDREHAAALADDRWVWHSRCQRFQQICCRNGHTPGAVLQDRRVFSGKTQTTARWHATGDALHMLPMLQATRCSGRTPATGQRRHIRAAAAAAEGRAWQFVGRKQQLARSSCA